MVIRGSNLGLYRQDRAPSRGKTRFASMLWQHATRNTTIIYVRYRTQRTVNSGAVYPYVWPINHFYHCSLSFERHATGTYGRSLDIETVPAGHDQNRPVAARIRLSGPDDPERPSYTPALQQRRCAPVAGRGQMESCVMAMTAETAA